MDHMRRTQRIVIRVPERGPPRDADYGRGANNDTRAYLNEAPATLTRVLAMCNQGLGRSQKSSIFGAQAAPIDLQTHPERWMASPSTFLDGFGGPTGPFGPQI
jgi:hypothetical protein